MLVKIKFKKKKQGRSCLNFRQFEDQYTALGKKWIKRKKKTADVDTAADMVQ